MGQKKHRNEACFTCMSPGKPQPASPRVIPSAETRLPSNFIRLQMVVLDPPEPIRPSLRRKKKDR